MFLPAHILICNDVNIHCSKLVLMRLQKISVCGFNVSVKSGSYIFNELHLYFDLV